MDEFTLFRRYFEALLFALTQADRIYGEQTRNPVVNVFISKMDGFFSWILLCLRHLEDLFQGRDDVQLRVYRSIFDFGTVFMTFMCDSPAIKAAMQSSIIVADILVLLWTWIDRRTQRPLFMIEPDPKEAECHGCIINCMLYSYTLDSDDAKRLLLDRFSDEGFGYAAAERFVLAGMAHADRMREASERDEWDHRIIGRNYRQIVEMFDGFTKIGDPTLIAALRNSSFIQVFVSGISAFTKRLWVEESPSTYLYPLMLISCEVQEWIDTPGIPTNDGICQLVRGGFFSIFLEATLYGPKSIAKGNKMSENWDTICKELVALVMAYASYRSALFAIREAIANLDPTQCEKLLAMVESTPTSALWKMLEAAFLCVITYGMIKPQELGKLAPAISRHAPVVILPYIVPKPVRKSIGISAIATTVQRSVKNI
ncbi:hypothetical protein H1R20_g4713, partial [Candolleomyces eurysporus]